MAQREQLGPDLIGNHHSHPDHPATASDFDHQWAPPWISYLTSSVMDGKATVSRSWRLTDDRSAMQERPLTMASNAVSFGGAMNTIRSLSPLRPYADGRQAVEVRGETVLDALQDLARRYPVLHIDLFGEQGEIQSHVNVVVNEEDVPQLQGTATRLQVDDRLIISPAAPGAVLSIGLMTTQPRGRTKRSRLACLVKPTSLTRRGWRSLSRV
jgi:molybdopterin converting factor small subunit